ncbi:MAG: hypothetical protein AAF533_16305 [Acidobacteriota bacterium]
MRRSARLFSPGTLSMLVLSTLGTATMACPPGTPVEPEPIGPVLRAAHDDTTITLSWNGSRDLATGESWVLRRSRDAVQGPYQQAHPEGLVQRAHVELLDDATLTTYLLSAETECGLSTDRSPSTYCEDLAQGTTSVLCGELEMGINSIDAASYDRFFGCAPVGSDAPPRPEPGQLLVVYWTTDSGCEPCFSSCVQSEGSVTTVNLEASIVGDCLTVLGVVGWTLFEESFVIVHRTGPGCGE